jgi:hypothetical protein
MRRWVRASAPLFLAIAAACAPRPAGDAAAPMPAAVAELGPLGAEAAAARDVVTAFIAAEAAAENPDTLLAPGADFLMSGIAVTRPPRLAGLNGPGSASVEAASTNVGGALAWVVVAYRFDARVPGLEGRARGTFVLEKQRAGWRIRHVHTSMVERWDR